MRRQVQSALLLPNEFRLLLSVKFHRDIVREEYNTEKKITSMLKISQIKICMEFYS